ncbi:MAG TPA: STAS domain-containing protein [Acidimicrobiales bacterium]|jgi:anti-anti-sigma factor|nr:STAS domain-containing protein [Acidimicrobiales bacterium]
MTSAASRFSLGFSRVDGRVIVSVEGALDGASAPQLRDRLRDLIEGQGNRHLVLDLARTTRVDPAGLAVLVGARGRLRTAGGELVLAGLSDEIACSLAAVGLDRVFPIAPSDAARANEAHGAVDRVGGDG